MRVLFVCTGNTCRSPMAAALATSLFPTWEVRSAGLAADVGAPMSPHAQAALAARGLDGSAHRSTQVTPEMVEWADRVLVMTEAHRRRLPGDHVSLLAATDVVDPYGGSLADYERCLAALDKALTSLHHLR